MNIQGGGVASTSTLTRTLQPGTYCFSFWYTVYRAKDSVKVTSKGQSESEPRVLWQSQGSTNKEWRFAKTEATYNAKGHTFDVSNTPFLEQMQS